ncbi:MAG: monovalent cation/H(+) antiporter subunit G [Thermodesulfobacteriota bacterium]
MIAVLIVVIVLVVAGIFFFFAATIGFLRFPDFYSRMHATGKGDTFGLLLSLIGLSIYNLYDHPSWYLGVVQSLKLISITVFWFLASPTATHALLRSAFESGVMPWTKDGKPIIERVERDKKA